MMRLDRLIVVFCLAFGSLLASCGNDAEEGTRGQAHVASDTLKNHVAILASDELEGRETGSKGYDEAAVYVAQQFQDIGLEPAGTQGTYFQPILFKKVRVIDKSAQVIVRTGDEPTLLQYGADYYFLINAAVPNGDITAPLVYAGYGVTAPDYGLNTYDGIDARGKIAVALAGVPEGLPPEEGAVFSSIDRKAADAQKAGAIGLAIVYTQKWEKVYNFANRSARGQKGNLFWLGADGEAFSSYGALQSIIRFSPEAGGLLFEGAKHSYGDIREAAAKGQPLPSFDLPAKLTAAHVLEEQSLVSSNVIARLPANAPVDEAAPSQGQKEAVMLISHLDHLGRGKAVDGDDLYNGAIDNALGVATILEASRALAALPQTRTRDIYFAALTAEEKGLLGAEYLARHLPVPEAQLKAVLNIDMPVALYPFATVQASGEVHSNLGALAGQAAARYGLGLEDDPMPKEAIFVRSDHYAFVQRGIPSLYLNIGVATPEGSQVDGFAALEGFLTTHYHRPSDEISLPIDWDAAARFADVHVEMLRDLSNADLAVAWSDGSFFNQPQTSN